MDWLTEVQERMKRKNQVLFAQDSVFLQDISALVEEQSRRTMVLWALGFADETARRLGKRYPNEKRLGAAVDLSKAWAAGKVKMPVAKRAILQAHAVAKDIDSPEDIALCHAVGQACGVVHAKGHAMGFPIYDLTAIVRHYGLPACRQPVEQRKREYIEKLHFWRQHGEDQPREWADFLMKD